LFRRSDLERSIWFGSNLVTALATSEETGGRYALLRLRNQRGYAPPPHRHGPEAFYVVRGVLRFDVAGEEFMATEGSLLEVPPDAWHTFSVESDEAEYLILTAPAWGLDQFFRQAGRPAEALEVPAERAGPPDLAKLQAAASQFQIEFAPPETSPGKLAGGS
jgi:quercetin dioxygenase-like cupin family protein